VTAGLVAFDVVLVVFAVVFYTGAGLAAERVYRPLAAVVPWPVAVVVASIVFLVVLVLEVSVASRLTPRPRPGRYAMMKSAVFWGWILRMAFARLLFLPGFKKVIFYSNVLRYLALRGLGANVAFSASMSSDVEILDPALLTVGAGAMLGARAFVSGHFIEKGELRLDEVRIGSGALIGMDAACGPGVVVGVNAVVQARVALSVRVNVGEAAVVGVGALLEADVVVADGAKVPARAHLAPRSRFPA
jgi:acetyltransferase-like isoleucine patch superfamily enzyme